MQPVKIDIQGDFWDSFVYQGLLYLWSMDGSISVFDWARAVDDLGQRLNMSTALEYAFSRGDYFYGDHTDAEKDALISGLRAMADMEITISLIELEPFLKCRLQTPFHSLHDDISIYNLHLYGLCENGLFRTSLDRSLGDDRLLQRNVEKCFDGIAGTFKIYDSIIALAAGSDGLLEINPETRQGKVVDGRHVSFANWQYASIMATSLISQSYLVGYLKRDERVGHFTRKVRDLIRPIDAEEIFDLEGICWGNMEKFYMLLDGKIHTRQSFKYTMERFLPEDQKTSGIEEWKRGFKSFEPFDIAEPISRLVHADTAYFGTILEFEDRIVVARSDGNTDIVHGESTRFRVFPRAKFYENHLHVIGEECLTIYSFNHDYFLDQNAKAMGVRHSRKVTDDSVENNEESENQ